MFRRDLVVNSIIIVIALTVIYTISAGSSSISAFAVFNAPNDSNETNNSNKTSNQTINQTINLNNISLPSELGPSSDNLSDIPDNLGGLGIPPPPVIDLFSGKIENMIGAMPYVSLLGDTNLCIMIETSNGPVSYDVAQTTDSLVVNKSERFCDGADLEDFIISFKNENLFDTYAEDPICSQFVDGVGSDYYVLSSRHVEDGGNIICNTEFSDNFCDSFTQCVSSGELINADLSCCISSELTLEQKVLLKQHLLSGRYIDETGIDLSDIKLPDDGKSILDSFTGEGNSLIKWILFIVIIGVVGAGAFFFVIKPRMFKDPEEEIDSTHQLYPYFEQTIEQGYNFEQIKLALLEQGWPEDIIDKEIASYYKKTQDAVNPGQDQQQAVQQNTQQQQK
jgi:flagellar basal body-associated protein FliL